MCMFDQPPAPTPAAVAPAAAPAAPMQAPNASTDPTTGGLRASSAARRSLKTLDVPTAGGAQSGLSVPL